MKPLLSNIRSWHTRLIGVLALACGVLFYYFLLRDEVFGWVWLVALVFPLWVIVRGGHIFFRLDDNSISWSADLRRYPTQTVLLADIVQIHVRYHDAGADIRVVDLRGVFHAISTIGDLWSPRVISRLRKTCPSAEVFES